MNNFNRDEIEKLLIKHLKPRIISCFQNKENYNAFLNELCNLQLGSLEEKEIFNILRDYISKKAIYDDSDLNNIAKSISHLKDKKTEQLKADIEKLKFKNKKMIFTMGGRNMGKYTKILADIKSLNLKEVKVIDVDYENDIAELKAENEKLRYRNEGFIDRR